MELTSKAFTDGGDLDARFAKQGVPGGENVIPDLAWSGAPEGTKSYALSVYDPDAPTGSGWWHMLAWDIPADVTEIAEGADLPEGAKTIANDYGEDWYGGPNPPAGPAHRYIHTVYALPVEKLDVDGLPSAPVRFNILAQALDQASITGMFAQPE